MAYDYSEMSKGGQKYIDYHGLDSHTKALDIINGLEAEVERLSQLLWGSRCAYCGEVVGKDKRSQDIANDVLRKHVEACPKHPLAQARAELKAEKQKRANMLGLCDKVRLYLSARKMLDDAVSSDRGAEVECTYTLVRLRMDSLMDALTRVNIQEAEL